MEITDEKWNQLVKRLDALEQSIFDDRKNLDKMQIDMATIKEQNERILGMQIRGQEKVTTAVQNAVSESTEPLREAVEVMTDKPIRITDEQANKLKENRSFLSRVRRWYR